MSYSDRKAFTGLALADLNDRYPTVRKAIKKVALNAVRKTAGPSWMR
ncbi:MAG TPA: hypothetical protein VEB86_05840 [Chryseosolibacter sp.]|nr:hypothetical protein [Chryseosolibacter sp.]